MEFHTWHGKEKRRGRTLILQCYAAFNLHDSCSCVEGWKMMEQQFYRGSSIHVLGKEVGRWDGDGHHGFVHFSSPATGSLHMRQTIPNGPAGTPRHSIAQPVIALSPYFPASCTCASQDHDEIAILSPLFPAVACASAERQLSRPAGCDAHVLLHIPLFSVFAPCLDCHNYFQSAHFVCEKK